ncbi:hypothetical protein RAD16_37965 [Bradyrhizobium sp. 18BD]
MKLALILPFLPAALVGAARAEDGDESREPTRAEAEAFNTRMYAGPPGDKAYACFVRRYDAEHLARHPKQKVASMKLLISAEFDKEDKELHNSFRLGFRYRHRSGDFDSSGSCGHAMFTKNGPKVRLGCGVDCEGGGIGVALSKDDKSVIVRLARVAERCGVHRHCERSEAIQIPSAEAAWIASSQGLLAMTAEASALPSHPA